MAAEIRDIGIDVASPKTECNDPNCPFHGSLPVRGQVIDGVVATVKMKNTVVVERNYLKYQQKYERSTRDTRRGATGTPPTPPPASA